MKINQLVPQPSHSESFRRDRLRYIPDVSGCYILATFSKVVLYIGLATNLRRRMNQHLENPERTREGMNGRAVLFYWIEIESQQINKIERTWMNIHIQHEGMLPEFNKTYSPVAT
jgi:excinuclease UvrABC nuclease subunit